MKNEKSKTEAIATIVEGLNIGGYKNHFLLCTGPRCCQEEEGLKIWNYLKKRIKELGLEKQVFRSKVSCLRICRDGPIALLYPNGDWYGKIDETLCEKLLQEVLIQKKDVSDRRFAKNPI